MQLDHRIESPLLVWSYRCLGLFLGPVMYNWKEEKSIIHIQYSNILQPTPSCTLATIMREKIFDSDELLIA
jgi:hypothetical protein